MLSLPGPFRLCCHSRNSIFCASINLKGSLHCSSIMASVATETKKTVWLWTKSKDVMTTSVESGWNTFVFTPETEELLDNWGSIAKIKPLFLNNKKICNGEDEQIALIGEVNCAEDLRALESLSDEADIVVMDASEWQIISSENLVAFFQNTQISIFAIARSAKEAQLFLESLEKGTDGIVLQTEDVAEVLGLKAFLASHAKQKIVLSSAIIKRVEHVGMGDRVCVDLCSLLNPGEGLLVGSFARALFLVHSECLETSYVASRPFRVNAGPVHAYVARPGGKTSYLAELQSGMQVLVVDAYGSLRSATVGRVKIETRPLVLVEAVLENHSSSTTTCSLVLQNAETVSLIHPPAGIDTGLSLAIPVTSLKAGDRVLTSMQDAARHTGIAIKEFILEK